MTRKVFFLAIFWSVIITIVYSYLFFILFKKNESTAFLVAETENLAKERVTLLTLRGQAAETVTSREKLADYFIPKDGVVPFLNGIQDLGRSNNLELKVNSVTVKDEESSPDQFEYLKLAVEGAGNWADVYRFSSLAELLPYKVIVDNVRFEKFQEGASLLPDAKKNYSKSGWKVTLELRVLKLK